MRAAKLVTGPVAVNVRRASAPEASLVAPTRARPLLIPSAVKRLKGAAELVIEILDSPLNGKSGPRG